MPKITLFLFLVISVNALGQLSKSDQQELRALLFKHVNDLREQRGVPPLQYNDTLQKAALLHSEYMAENNELTHDEKKSRYATPEKRVKSQKGKDLDAIGENVAQSGPYDFPANKRELSVIAEALFMTWKNSPGHYANMINPEYSLGDFGFSVSTTTKIIYGTQVFAKYGIRVDGQLSRNSFGITQAPEDCDDVYKGFSNLVMSMGNSTQIEGNEVLMYYHDITFFNRLLTQSNDGFAVDLIARDQVLCGRANQLDFSPIYDGILLKPVYKEELLAGNTAQSDYRLISRIGTIPPTLNGEAYSASLILIKNGEKCKYLVPVFVPMEDYAPTPIDLRLDRPAGIQLSEKGIVHSQTLTYEFNTSDVGAIQLPSIVKRSEKVHSVRIQSYSSIEGDSLKNHHLHQSRANSIRNHLATHLKISEDQLFIDAKENWELMDFQLNYFSREDLAALSHDSIKKLVASKDTLLPWDSLLYAQRRATATIYYYGEYSSRNATESLAEFNLRTAVATNNSALANAALVELFEQKSCATALLFDPLVYDYFTKHPECVANYAAVLSLCVQENPYQVTSFLFHWQKRGNQLSDNATFNLLHLYAITSHYLLDHWDVASERLANVIHPTKVNALSTSEMSNELLLNLHIAFIDYYGQINDQKGINQSFYFIADHFRKAISTHEEIVKLALFFNYWSSYPMTIELLESKHKEVGLEEEGLFTLIHTKTLSLDDISKADERYLQLHQEVAEKYPFRWCEWLNADFQILRNHKVKQLYCEICE